MHETDIGWAALCLAIVSDKTLLSEKALHMIENGKHSRFVPSIDLLTVDAFAMQEMREQESLFYKDIGDLFGLDRSGVFKNIQRFCINGGQRYIPKRKYNKEGASSGKTSTNENR